MVLNSKLANVLLDPSNAFSLGGLFRAGEEGPGPQGQGLTPDIILKLTKFILFIGATIGLFSLACRMAAGKLNAEPVHYGLEFLGFAGLVAAPLAFENKKLFEIQKRSHKDLLKATHVDLIKNEKGRGASYGPHVKIAAYGVRAEVALIVFKLLLLSGLCVAGALGIAKMLSVVQVGIMGLALGGGYYLGSYLFRAGINYSQLKAEEAIEAKELDVRALLA